MTTLTQEFDYFIEHQEELAEKYKGKYIVIHEGEVVGAYDSALEATNAARKKFQLGEFLVQLARVGTDAITQSYYSRVAV